MLHILFQFFIFSCFYCLCYFEFTFLLLFYILTSSLPMIFTCVSLTLPLPCIVVVPLSVVLPPPLKE